MKKIYHTGKILLLTVVLLSSSIAQSAGNSGLAFLKIGSGARNIALGDNGAVFANDVSSIFYNPANLQCNAPEVILTHNVWIQDAATELLGVSFSLFNIPFGVGINSTSIKGIEVRTQPGEPEATFNTHYFFASLSAAIPVTDELSFGVTTKYLYEDIFYDNAEGIGFDFGVKYKTVVENLFVSGVVRNIGSMNQLQKEATKLPAEIRVGPAYTINFPESKIALQIGGEFQKYLSQNDIHLNVGAECLYDNWIAVRAGYQTNYLVKNISAGAGLFWSNITFDYAFTPFAYSLGQAQTISLKYGF